MSGAAVDLATAIENLQRVERAALGLDRNEEPARGNVVIIVPAKLSEADWVASVEGGRVPPEG